MEDIRHLVVAGAVVEKDGNILLVKEKKKKAYGLWNVPAGWMNGGESPSDGAKREVKEETNLDIDITGLVGVYVFMSPVDANTVVTKFVFKGSVGGGELKIPEDEILEAKWFKPSEILSMKDSELRGIRKEIEDFASGKLYPLDVIKSR
jgi:8-oxo-dGTP diphosphatase